MRCDFPFTKLCWCLLINLFSVRNLVMTSRMMDSSILPDRDSKLIGLIIYLLLLTFLKDRCYISCLPVLWNNTGIKGLSENITIMDYIDFHNILLKCRDVYYQGLGLCRHLKKPIFYKQCQQLMEYLTGACQLHKGNPVDCLHLHQ